MKAFFFLAMTLGSHWNLNLMESTFDPTGCKSLCNFAYKFRKKPKITRPVFGNDRFPGTGFKLEVGDTESRFVSDGMIFHHHRSLQ